MLEQTIQLATNIGNIAKDASGAMNRVMVVRDKDKDDNDNGIAIATNGKCLAMCAAKIKNMPDEKVYLPADLTCKTKDKPIIISDGKAEYNAGKNRKPKMVSEPLPDKELRYPPVQSILPPVEKYTAWIHFDFAELKKLVDSICPGDSQKIAIGIDFNKNDNKMNLTTKPMIVSHLDTWKHSGGAGLMMPVSVDDSASGIQKYREMVDKIPYCVD